MELLLGESKDLTVISVLGMGGSGKTSLVASLLRSPVVKKHFCGFYAWITISQTNYTIDNVLRSIFKEFADRVEDNVNPQELNTMNQVQLVKMIMKKLQHKRYLVVLDDVWEIENMWLVLKSALLENSLGSRILLTTRKEDVATFSLGTKRNVYNVRPLTENKAWELFWKKALPHDPDQCSTQLLQTARNLIKKCGGLPLGIATLGALMSTKKLEFPDWEGVLRSLNWELSNNQRLNSLKSILLLSFYELPNRLKQCFLYCGNFPEDFEINPRRLARLWIAEGFVELGRGMTHDMMAERYITELVHRGLLQFTRRNHSTQCLTMHDLNREFAVSIAEEEGFFHVYNGQETNQHNKVYRLAVHENYRGAFGSMSKVRSFFVFGSNIVDSSLLLQNLPCDFTLLRVLDLKDFPIPELSKNIVNCYNLTYLCLKRTQVKELPKGIGKLRNLQTLDIRQTEIKVLPKGIVKLTNLRHLFMRQFNYAAKLMEFDHFNICYSTKALAAGLSNLKKLQVLDSVEAGKDTIRELRSLTQLTKIGLTNVHEVDGEDLCILIKEMKCMNFLLLQASNVNEVLKIDELSNLASQFLAKLYLIGKLERLPCWLASLECLKILFLSWSRITDGELILSHVSTLPNLTTLSLIKSYEGNQLWFENGFVKLEILLLCCMPQLNEVIIERGVMPQLEKLFIVRCSHLLIPRAISNVAKFVCSTEVDPRIVSSDSFTGFMKLLNPHFELDYTAVQAECVAIFLKEKSKIMEILGNFDGEISVSVREMGMTKSFVLVSLHFIDENWSLKNWVIKFCSLVKPSFVSPCDVIVESLKDWSIKNKVSTVTMSFFFDDDAFDFIKEHGLEDKKLSLNGDMFRVYCCSDCISSMVQNAFEEVEGITNKIRCLYNPKSEPLWYLTSSKLKDAIELWSMGEFSSENVTDYSDVPTVEEWNRVEQVCNIVESIYKVAYGIFHKELMTTYLEFEMGQVEVTCVLL
ncbi:hypothetical protein G4B88_003847 [Cannabis sativa]|uniref:NB-ARC domain-containing protein n=1 Tax=Cannabis sativa TaxID=3483 RepID=A0A7J6FL63_CANSA|nr:hypothetical protein G4B88_003847 [Cannabis sativa]